MKATSASTGAVRSTASMPITCKSDPFQPAQTTSIAHMAITFVAFRIEDQCLQGAAFPGSLFLLLFSGPCLVRRSSKSQFKVSGSGVYAVPVGLWSRERPAEGRFRRTECVSTATYIAAKLPFCSWHQG